MRGSLETKSVSTAFIGQTLKVEATPSPSSKNSVSFLASSGLKLFWPKQAEAVKTSDVPTAAPISFQVRPLLSFASKMASVISNFVIIDIRFIIYVLFQIRNWSVKKPSRG